VSEGHPEGDHPIIRDRRRIDPQTGGVRGSTDTSAPSAAQPPSPGAPDRSTELEAQLAERTADLQRVTAEYANYRRRVDRDRTAVAEQALASVLLGLLPVLDDIGRAREHGELEGGFKSVGESLEAVVTKLGLERYGEVGDPFDPTIHEALMHSHDDSLSEPTCVQVMQAGYRLGERILRAARVAVAEPSVATPDQEPAQESSEE
jgi:molecular chaperone GrpE